MTRSKRLSRATGAGAIMLACSALAATAALSAAPSASAGSAGGAPVDPTAIPLGDGHVGTHPEVGYVDSCRTSFRGGGAEHGGPWIDEAAGTWNETAKIAVRGAVSWPSAYYRSTLTAGKRVVRFDDLPVDHPSGRFPIATGDPAYAYDRNPNHIAARATTWTLPRSPKAARTPTCLGLGPIGVLADGVYLYDALDAAGRDAAAYEVQDACGGHPDGSSRYHHHDVPSCLLDKAPNGAATLVGYALDGYGIYVVKDAKGNLPVNGDLDACHGTTSTVPWNGKERTVYHYVATLEYPYTVGCYHGTPIRIDRAARRAKGPGARGPRPGGGRPGAPGPGGAPRP